MTAQRRSVAANTTYYTAALTFQKILSFVYFSFLARSLGADTTGQYFFALSVAAITMVLMDLGLTPLLTREAATKPDETPELLNSVVGMKAILGIIVAVGAVIIIPWSIENPVTEQLLYIAIAIALFDSWSQTFFAAIRAKQNLFYESIAAGLFQLITFTLGGIAIYKGYDIRVIIMALFTASLINMLISIGVLKFVYNISPNFSLKKDLIQKIARLAIPFALAAIFVKVYAYIDTVFLKFIAGDEAVGIYSVAYKLTFAFQFLPLAFVASLYPAFSDYWSRNKERLSVVYARSIEYLLVVSVPIVFGTFAIAHNLIPAIYTSDFNGSVAPLIILMSSLPFLFINFPIGALLNACNRQNRQTFNLGVTMVVNIVLNLLLIPKYGPTGAAIASALSTLFIFIIGMLSIRSLVSINVARTIRRLVLLLLAAGVMFVSVWYAQLTITWYYGVLVGLVVYPIALFVFRVVTKDDIIALKKLLRR